MFSSETKFDSGTGWPSFWAPVDPTHVIEVSCRGFHAYMLFQVHFKAYVLLTSALPNTVATIQDDHADMSRCVG